MSRPKSYHDLWERVYYAPEEDEDPDPATKGRRAFNKTVELLSTLGDEILARARKPRTPS